MKRKRRICRLLIVAVLTSIFLTGCMMVPMLPKSDSDYMTTDEKATLWGEQIMECIVKEDTETLKSMYCVNVQNMVDLDAEIPKIYEFLDGEIVSYDEPFGTAGGGVVDMGITVEKGAVGYVSNIVTDKGTVYKISYSGYVLFKEDSNNIGIEVITIRNCDLFDYYFEQNSDFYISKTKEAALVEVTVGIDSDLK